VAGCCEERKNVLKNEGKYVPKAAYLRMVMCCDEQKNFFYYEYQFVPENGRTVIQQLLRGTEQLYFRITVL
jgi:hypothetical protein